MLSWLTRLGTMTPRIDVKQMRATRVVDDVNKLHKTACGDRKPPSCAMIRYHEVATRGNTAKHEVKRVLYIEPQSTHPL